MKTYSVKDISDMLDTNPETVRRWIRSGKLKANQHSRKDGNTVREDELYKYLRSTSKYAGIAAGMAAASPLLVLSTAVGAGIIGIIAATIGARENQEKEDVQTLSENIELTLRKNIAESQDAIKKKRAAIDELQREILKEQQQVADYQNALDHLDDALSKVQDNEGVEGKN